MIGNLFRKRLFQSMQSRGICIQSIQHDAGNGVMEIVWEDGKKSNFHPVWLKDHDPNTIHETSKQRQLDSAGLDLSTILPDVVKMENDGKKAVFGWGNDQLLEFQADWLRQHSYDEWAINERKQNGKFHWDSKTMSKEDIIKIDSSKLLTNDESIITCLEAVEKYGVVIIENMPSTQEDTEEIVRKIGPPRETFYGAMWDTAPKNAQDVNDTAYTKDALHVHTDTSYLADSAGLQLFNCVAQSVASNPSSLEGTTKLVDGFRVLDELKINEPSTYQFLCENPLKWFSIEDGVYVQAYEKVIEFEPNTENYRQFRYNSYDLAPVDYLDSDKIMDYYKHTKILNEYLRSDEFISYVRLQVGEMVIIDNHRVCHGRTSFTGYRNMVGCYVGKDDWTSKLRSLKSQA